MVQPDRIERRYAHLVPTIFRDEVEPHKLEVRPMVLGGADAYSIGFHGRAVGFAYRMHPSLDPIPQRLPSRGFGIAPIDHTEITLSFGRLGTDMFNSLQIHKIDKSTYVTTSEFDQNFVTGKEPVFIGVDYSKGKQLQLRKNLNHIDARYCTLSLVRPANESEPVLLVENLSRNGSWIQVKSTRGEFIVNPYIDFYDTPADPRNGLENIKPLRSK